jgi:hypothetical protein
LQLSYRFEYSYSKNDRQVQAFADELAQFDALRQALSINRYNIDGAMDYMLSNGYLTNNDDYTTSISNRQSQFSEYRNYNHTIGFTFRKITDMYNLSAGVELLPQHSVLNYKYMGKEYPNVKRTVYNFTPTLDFRYNFDKQTQLRANYRGRTSQPSMTNLLDIEDDSNPMNISKGNPGLKPSLEHSLRLDYNTYNADLQQGIFVFSNIFAYQQRQMLENRKGAIVITPSLTIKKTPSAGSSDVSVIHEGTRVDITDDTMRDWKAVRLADGREGWVPARQIEKI